MQVLHSPIAGLVKGMESIEKVDVTVAQIMLSGVPEELALITVLVLFGKTFRVTPHYPELQIRLFYYLPQQD